MKNKQFFGILITLLGGCFWGLSGTCGEFLFTHYQVNANWLVPLRLLSAGFILLLIQLIRDNKHTLGIWKNKKDAFDLIIYTIFGITLCQYFYFTTIEVSNAGTATVLQYLAPVLIIITVCIIEHKFPRKVDILATFLAMLGIFLLATNGNIHQLAVSPKALFVGILTAFTVVIYNVQPKRLLQKYSSLTLLGWAMFIGGIVLFFIFNPLQYHPNLDIYAVLAFGGIVFLGTILSFTLYLHGVHLIGPQKAILYACMEPVSAMFLSCVWLGSSFTFMDILGTVLIISTLFVINLF